MGISVTKVSFNIVIAVDIKRLKAKVLNVYYVLVV